MLPKEVSIMDLSAEDLVNKTPVFDFNFFENENQLGDIEQTAVNEVQKFLEESLIQQPDPIAKEKDETDLLQELLCDNKRLQNTNTKLRNEKMERESAFAECENKLSTNLKDLIVMKEEMAKLKESLFQLNRICDGKDKENLLLKENIESLESELRIRRELDVRVEDLECTQDDKLSTELAAQTVEMKGALSRLKVCRSRLTERNKTICDLKEGFRSLWNSLNKFNHSMIKAGVLTVDQLELLNKQHEEHMGIVSSSGEGSVFESLNNIFAIFQTCKIKATNRNTGLHKDKDIQIVSSSVASPSNTMGAHIHEMPFEKNQLSLAVVSNGRKEAVQTMSSVGINYSFNGVEESEQMLQTDKSSDHEFHNSLLSSEKDFVDVSSTCHIVPESFIRNSDDNLVQSLRQGCPLSFISRTGKPSIIKKDTQIQIGNSSSTPLRNSFENSSGFTHSRVMDTRNLVDSLQYSSDDLSLSHVNSGKEKQKQFLNKDNFLQQTYHQENGLNEKHSNSSDSDLGCTDDCSISAKRCQDGSVKLNLNLNEPVKIRVNPRTLNVSYVIGPFNNASKKCSLETYKFPSIKNGQIDSITDGYSVKDGQDITSFNETITSSPKRYRRETSEVPSCEVETQFTTNSEIDLHEEDYNFKELGHNSSASKYIWNDKEQFFQYGGSTKRDSGSNYSRPLVKSKPRSSIFQHLVRNMKSRYPKVKYPKRLSEDMFHEDVLNPKYYSDLSEVIEKVSEENSLTEEVLVQSSERIQDVPDRSNEYSMTAKDLVWLQNSEMIQGATSSSDEYSMSNGHVKKNWKRLLACRSQLKQQQETSCVSRSHSVKNTQLSLADSNKLTHKLMPCRVILQRLIIPEGSISFPLDELPHCAPINMTSSKTAKKRILTSMPEMCDENGMVIIDDSSISKSISEIVDGSDLSLKAFPIYNCEVSLDNHSTVKSDTPTQERIQNDFSGDDFNTVETSLKDQTAQFNITHSKLTSSESIKSHHLLSKHNHSISTGEITEDPSTIFLDESVVGGVLKNVLEPLCETVPSPFSKSDRESATSFKMKKQMRKFSAASVVCLNNSDGKKKQKKKRQKRLSEHTLHNLNNPVYSSDDDEELQFNSSSIRKRRNLKSENKSSYLKGTSLLLENESSTHQISVSKAPDYEITKLSAPKKFELLTTGVKPFQMKSAQSSKVNFESFSNMSSKSKNIAHFIENESLHAQKSSSSNNETKINRQVDQQIKAHKLKITNRKDRTQLNGNFNSAPKKNECVVPVRVRGLTKLKAPISKVKNIKNFDMPTVLPSDLSRDDATITMPTINGLSGKDDTEIISDIKTSIVLNSVRGRNGFYDTSVSKCKISQESINKPKDTIDEISNDDSETNSTIDNLFGDDSTETLLVIDERRMSVVEHSTENDDKSNAPTSEISGVKISEIVSTMDDLFGDDSTETLLAIDECRMSVVEHSTESDDKSSAPTSEMCGVKMSEAVSTIDDLFSDDSTETLLAIDECRMPVVQHSTEHADKSNMPFSEMSGVKMSETVAVMDDLFGDDSTETLPAIDECRMSVVEHSTESDDKSNAPSKMSGVKISKAVSTMDDLFGEDSTETLLVIDERRVDDNDQSLSTIDKAIIPAPGRNETQIYVPGVDREDTSLISRSCHRMKDRTQMKPLGSKRNTFENFKNIPQVDKSNSELDAIYNNSVKPKIRMEHKKKSWYLKQSFCHDKSLYQDMPDKIVSSRQSNSEVEIKSMNNIPISRNSLDSRTETTVENSVIPLRVKGRTRIKPPSSKRSASEMSKATPQVCESIPEQDAIYNNPVRPKIRMEHKGKKWNLQQSIPNDQSLCQDINLASSSPDEIASSKQGCFSQVDIDSMGDSNIIVTSEVSIPVANRTCLDSYIVENAHESSESLSKTNLDHTTKTIPNVKTSAVQLCVKDRTLLSPLNPEPSSSSPDKIVSNEQRCNSNIEIGFTACNNIIDTSDFCSPGKQHLNHQQASGLSKIQKKSKISFDDNCKNFIPRNSEMVSKNCNSVAVNCSPQSKTSTNLERSGQSQKMNLTVISKKLENYFQKTEAERLELLRKKYRGNDVHPITEILQTFGNKRFTDDIHQQDIKALLNSLINPSLAPDAPSLLLHIFQYLACSAKNPLLTPHYHTLLPTDEKAIVGVVFKIEKRQKHHLHNLVPTALSVLPLLVVSKRGLSGLGLSALTRVFTEICRRLSKPIEPLQLCCELLKTQNPFAPHLITNVAAVWREIFHPPLDESEEIKHLLLRVISYGVHKMIKKKYKNSSWAKAVQQWIVVPNLGDLNALSSVLLARLVELCFQPHTPENEREMLWTQSCLSILGVHEEWKWTEEHIMNHVVENILQFGRHQPNERGFSAFANLYVDIYIKCPGCSEENVLRSFFESDSGFTQDIAALSLIRFFLLLRQPLPLTIMDWFKKNQQNSRVSEMRSLFQRRLMSDVKGLVLEDISGH